MQSEVLYTRKQVAALLGCNNTYVGKLIKAGLLPATKLGSTKVLKSDFDTFVKFAVGKDLRDPFNVRELNPEP